MTSRSHLHRLSLRGKAGFITAILATSICYLCKVLVADFALGEGGVAFLPINFFEFILAGILALGILICYVVLIRINKRRIKNSPVWSKNAKSIRIQFFIYILLGLFSLFLLLHFGKIKWIIPLILFLFAGFSFHIRKKTIGNTVLLTVFGLIACVEALSLDTYQFEIAMLYFGPVLLIYSLRPSKAR